MSYDFDRHPPFHPYHRQCALFLLTCLALFGLAAPSVAAAEPDVLYVVAGTPTHLDPGRLLANDSPLGEATITIERAPRVGQLDPFGDAFLYHPSGRYGQDDFSYRLHHAGSASVAEVRIVILPPMLPVTGRWPTKSEWDTEPCSVGDGAEIGFYYPLEERFLLCNFVGTDLVGCESRSVPPSVSPTAYDTADTSVRQPVRLPVIGRWNSAQVVDVPALYDPTAGEIETFDYVPECTARGCLVSTGTQPLDLAGGHPLVAEWASHTTSVSGYDWFSQGITSGWGSGMNLSMAGEAWPVVGSWGWRGDVLLGRWDPLANQLHYLADPSGQSTGVLNPDLQDAGFADNIAFTGRWSRCSSQTYFGVLQWQSGIIGLFEVLSDGHARPPVHVKVPVDPPDVPDGD